MRTLCNLIVAVDYERISALTASVQAVFYLRLTELDPLAKKHLKTRIIKKDRHLTQTCKHVSIMFQEA